ncbi:hypothetical protein ACFPZ0_27755, partial [Streptomonospora nanhaiensis]|uniref:hypothetical protein n=1 Tax=Streptomonospora nanhaiensis TaxID=1323731 RepID=UPI00361D5B52
MILDSRAGSRAGAASVRRGAVRTPPGRTGRAARTRFEAAEAVTRLENSSVLHGHMRAVFPAGV